MQFSNKDLEAVLSRQAEAVDVYDEAGFRIITLPAASDGAAFHAAISIG